mmetsp:Transcript_33870/g.83258  ORF Transcript_33870/g.83258 Transcript_33870/m.83258 type:complete len:202 (-) Transcript_33870:182-787(-)
MQTNFVISMMMIFGISRLMELLHQPLYVTLAVQAVVIISLPKVMAYFGIGQPKKIVGQDAPPLDGLVYVQGNPVKYSSEKITVVEFWATWCPPCRSSIPHLDAVYKKYGSQVDFVGITKENKATVDPFIEKMKDTFTYPVASDLSGEVSAKFPVEGIPAAFIVGKDGKVAWQGHPMSGLEEAIEAALRPPETSPPGQSGAS